MAKTKFPPAIWQSLLLTVILAIAFWIAVGLTGYVEGTEFSPATFQTRSFWYWEVPLLRLQIYPIDRTVSTHPVVLMLRSRGDLTAQPAAAAGAPGVWDLATVQHGPSRPRIDDANLLLEQFDIRWAGKSHWESWTAEHPADADALWPLVIALVRADLYVLLPHAFDETTVSQSDRGVDFSDRLHARLAAEVDGWVADLTAAGRPDDARQIADRWDAVVAKMGAAA